METMVGTHIFSCIFSCDDILRCTIVKLKKEEVLDDSKSHGLRHVQQLKVKLYDGTEMAPMTFTGIQCYLGATGFYRRFIKGYAKKAKPLLILDDNSKLKKEEVLLTPEAIEAFQQLKVKCMTAPVLAFANFMKPFLLETDASGDGLGVVLQQKQADGKYHPVAFAS